MAAITVLGAGMMGSALCVPLCDRGHRVRLVGTHLDGEIIAALARGDEHPTLRQRLPDAIEPLPLARLGEAMVGCEVLGLGVSSAGVRWAAGTIGPYLRPDLPVFGITKGLDFDGERLRLLPDLLRAGLPAALRDRVQPAAIAGPCIAGELARRVPSCVLLAGRDRVTLERIAALVRTDYYHVWCSTDLAGAEICAALKNAYAMGVALASGLHEQAGGAPGSVAMHNYEAAIFAEAVHEMARLVALSGGRVESVAGLAGAGDLDVTNNGGRTGRFGRLLGLGLTVTEAVERMAGATLECLEVLAVMRPALRAMQRRGEIEPGALPLLEHLAEVALDGAVPSVPFARFFDGEGREA